MKKECNHCGHTEKDVRKQVTKCPIKGCDGELKPIKKKPKKTNKKKPSKKLRYRKAHSINQIRQHTHNH